LIIWNHRWEFDKAPASFFNALREVQARGIDFRVALLGENFSTIPREFPAARDEFGSRIIRYGYVKSREEYEAWLDQGDIVVSTAIQENFGISIVEAVAHGCRPVLPNRLSYPEILPDEYHSACLYDADQGPADLLARALTEPLAVDQGLVDHARSFAWQNRIGEFDRIMSEVVEEAVE
jgi:glycosyltransferase involved in cell wall biosynthesis